MRTGDLVHVPAGVTLIRTCCLDKQLDIESTIYFKTKCPKKAIYLENTLPYSVYACIEYGENTWLVNKKDITLMEFSDGC